MLGKSRQKKKEKKKKIPRTRSDLPCDFLSFTVDIEPRHACVQSKERERARIQAYHAGIFPYCELCGLCIVEIATEGVEGEWLCCLPRRQLPTG